MIFRLIFLDQLVILSRFLGKRTIHLDHQNASILCIGISAGAAAECRLHWIFRQPVMIEHRCNSSKTLCVANQSAFNIIILLLCKKLYCIHATRRIPHVSTQPPVWPRCRRQIWCNSMGIMTHYFTHPPVCQQPGQKCTARLHAWIQYKCWLLLCLQHADA